MRQKLFQFALAVGLVMGAALIAHALGGNGGGTGGGTSNPSVGTTLQLGNGAGGFLAGTPETDYLVPANGLAGIATAGTQATARSNLGLGTVATANNPVAGSITGTAWAPLYTSYNDTITTLVNNSSTATIETTADVFPYWHNYSGALGASLSAVLPTNGGIYNNVIAFHVTQTGSNSYVFNTPTTSAAGGIKGPSCGQLAASSGAKFDIAYSWDDGDSSWNAKCTFGGVTFVESPSVTDNMDGTCAVQLTSAACAASGITGCTEINRIQLPANGDCSTTTTLTLPASTTMEQGELFDAIVTGGTSVFPSAITWSAGSSGVSMRTLLPGSTNGALIGSSPLCTLPPASTASGIESYQTTYNSSNSRLTENLPCGSYPPLGAYPITMGGTASKKGVPYVWSGQTASVGTSTTDFIGFGETPGVALVTSEDNAISSWPVGSISANASNLLCYVTTTPTASVTFFVRKNKTNSILTCTVNSGQTVHNGRYWCSDVTDTATIGFTAGSSGSSFSDLVDVSIANGITSTTGVAGCSFQIAG